MSQKMHGITILNIYTGTEKERESPWIDTIKKESGAEQLAKSVAERKVTVINRPNALSEKERDKTKLAISLLHPAEIWIYISRWLGHIHPVAFSLPLVLLTIHNNRKKQWLIYVINLLWS